MVCSNGVSAGREAAVPRIRSSTKGNSKELLEQTAQSQWVRPQLPKGKPDLWTGPVAARTFTVGRAYERSDPESTRFEPLGCGGLGRVVDRHDHRLHQHTRGQRQG